jgi:hypothetical protein
MLDRFIQGITKLTSSFTPLGTYDAGGVEAHTHAVTNPLHNHTDRWLVNTSGGNMGYVGTTGTLGGLYTTYDTAQATTVSSYGSGVTRPANITFYAIIRHTQDLVSYS